MSEWPRVDFEKLVQKVTRSSRKGHSDLSIWGGVCDEGELMAFLNRWDLGQMPYRIWEYVSEIDFERVTMPENIALLERGRLFGPGGDLELRRDGDRFLWRFIGPAGVQPPVGNYGAQNYWDSHEGVTFYEQGKTALLWGKWDGEKWTDARVGAARLIYPSTGDRIQIRYKVYSRAGRVEFVWLTGVEEGEND